MNLGTPALSATGLSGELRSGYQLAGRFGGWKLAVHRKSPESEESSIVTITSLEPDGYWFGELPHSVRLQVGERMWVWREAERIDETHYRLLGEPEVQ
jgi:hypothetical protein